jgi:Concanavalin A-like lectin/glucanases superfamily
VQAAPGSALRFDGVNGYVQVAPNANLNAYPLTATAWFRTTNGAAAVQGIVSKYTESSGNGWGLVVQNGHLRGFHFRQFYYNWLVGWVTARLDATSAVSVADGFWHQAALVVDDSGETLYLDGLQAGSSTWTPGFPGPQTSTDPLQIGGYSYYPNRFLGDIDEVTVWNRSLGVAEINYLKHRHLNGNEDGLVALWHLDENGGTLAGDATGHGYLGTFTLANSPAWVASSAPLVFNQVSSNALQFDGVNGYVQVAHTNDLNSYPFSSTAWFRTTNSASVLQGIVSKCRDGIADGWALGVDNGHLRGFYYINGTLATNAIDATSAASVADGSWHHAALVVDGSGGKLFLDGNVVGSSGWLPSASSAGAPTTHDPLLIGRYSTRAARFLGDIDEVTVWNRALAATEVQSLKNLRLAGTETGLVAYWHLDEGSGTSTADATGHGHTGTLVNGPGPVWTGSTAFLGDGTSVIHTMLGAVQWTRQFAVKTIPGESGFAASAPFWVRRLDDFGAAGGTTNVSVVLQYALQSALLAGPVPLANNSAQFNSGLTSYNAAVPQASAGGVIQSPVLDIEPQSGTQLDSVNDTFQLGVTELYSVNGGPTVSGETTTLAPAQLLHFDGNLFFGSLATFFTSIANSPAPGAVRGGGLNTQLAINNNSGSLTANPVFHYGDGTPLNVVLLSNGDAQAAAGTVAALSGADTVCLQNVCFSRASVTLSNNLISGLVTLQLPTGFGFTTNTDTRITSAQVTFANLPLDSSLMPIGVPTVTASLYGVEETKPFWIRASTMEWHPAEGTIVLPNPLGLVYVHQAEDDMLLQNQASLVDTNAAYRVSNDGYYANISPGPGSAVVRADTNGAALLSLSTILSAGGFYPHFPYFSPSPYPGSSISPGLYRSIPTPGGVLVISNGLVDTTASFLTLWAPVPLAYNRDCADTNCSASLAGPAELLFTADASRLLFTPDGGLLASGTVPAQNLAWGSVGGSDFAQNTSAVGAGWFHMPGTFLRGDQTWLADALRPVVLLFSGFGDTNNPAYVERPGMTSYSVGWANYAGVNFRAPSLGRSIIAGQTTAWYPLVKEAKYYARLGGVSGIHQAATFATNLTLYGYAFTFLHYAVSYLDSENWQSLTDGSLVLPYPSGFTQEFAEMKFLCRGALGSARVPASSGSKLMQYWHTAITPQTVEFRPTTNDTCSLTTRYLVLGVETKLPLIPQAFHALLGFQTNGNLATGVTAVEGVDSRFAVPPEISLQGSGNSHYTFSTAGEGYFNNWEEAPNTPGFFNLAGRIKFPFFVNSKTHLHIEPTGTNNNSPANVFIMGGWPSPDLGGPDNGWNDGSGNNFFNLAKFDPANRGFPVGVKLTDYRRVTGASSLPPGLYRPRAQRDWIEVAKFDYSLQWQPVLREFSSYEDALVTLPMIDVKSRLKALTPGKVDLDFAQDIELSLPRIKLLDLANDALGEVNLPLSSVEKAVQAGLNTTLNVAGFTSLQRVLRDQMDDLLRPVLGTALAGPVASLYTSLSNQLATLPVGFQTNIATLTSNSLLNATTPYLQDISGKVAGQLNQAMSDVNGTLNQFLDILRKDATGKRPVVSRLLTQIAGDQGAPLAAFAGSAADDLLKDLEPTLAAVESRLREVQAQFNQLQSGGQFGQALGAVTADTAALNQFVQLSGTGLSKYLSTAVTPAGDFFTANPAAAQAAIREQLIRAFLGSPLSTGYQQTIKQLLYEQDALLTQLMDTLFQQINQAIREGISTQLAGATDLVPQQMKGPSSTLAAAQIRGAPTFNGDALKKIRLDAKVQMSLPDKINFNAYMEITELDSSTTPLDCIPAGDAAAEIKIGALDVPLDWTGISQPGKPMTVSLEAKWTQQNGNVLGVGGMLDIKGEIGFKGCSVDELGATLAIGATENYFAAKAAGSINVLGIPVDLQAGVFVGKTCSLAPLKLVDPECGQVLGNPAEFAGIYVAYGASLSLSEIIFRTSSCMLDIDASVSSALFYEGGATNQMVGMRQKMALEVSLLCLISGHVDWAAFSSLEHRGSITDPYGYTLTMGGSANLCGKIGVCPFCVQACKGITIKGIVNTGGIDYSVDY